ncbi:Yhc1 protein [Pichia kluyveri]|uniref:Yhc1 protein n=1 Tax=Pichia kluyveri TaxID=36015 RepID=A0AAV5QZ68_PICKL|nr:Yhc1 protein [Pichia kluyveri]
MGKYYCHYCQTHLTHDSPSVRKSHLKGRTHCQLVEEYYRNVIIEKKDTIINTNSTNSTNSTNPLNSLLFKGIPGSSNNPTHTLILPYPPTDNSLPYPPPTV